MMNSGKFFVPSLRAGMCVVLEACEVACGSPHRNNTSMWTQMRSCRLLLMYAVFIFFIPILNHAGIDFLPAAQEFPRQKIRGHINIYGSTIRGDFTLRQATAIGGRSWRRTHWYPTGLPSADYQGFLSFLCCPQFRSFRRHEQSVGVTR